MQGEAPALSYIGLITSLAQILTPTAAVGPTKIRSEPAAEDSSSSSSRKLSVGVEVQQRLIAICGEDFIRYICMYIYV
jgi:hypothetical protein